MKRRADYDVGTIENRVEVEVNDAVSAITKLVGSLNTLKSSLNNTINSTKNNKLKENIANATSNTKNFKKALGLGVIYAGLRKIASITADVSKANIDMIETNNLFEVAMGKVVDQYGNLDEKASQYYIKAMSFQDEMNEKLATNKSELMKYQSMYYSMFKGQGINKDASYTMSESLTKAGYDIASLYNLSVEEAMNKIKSGIAGQVESLRTIGIDVSESSLSKVLNEVGIERSVQQLSYAEKEVARYIAIIEQAGQAQGDFAKTFESPANQIRVFKNQLIELKQVAGSFIMNAFGGIIVWANAIIMAIKEILKAIASLFGYDLNSGGSNNLADNIGISDINSGLGSANKKAKELKKQLMGFDEINNISPASKSGGSGGSGVATGVDDKLLKSLKEWDNKMSSISGKAQEYRDKILEALGFTRGINGELKWSWKDMNKILKIIITIAGIIGGILIIGKIAKLINWLKKLITILKTGKGATTTFGLGLQVIGKIIGGLKSGFANLSSWISMVIGNYKVFYSQGNGIIGSLKMTKTALAETGQGFLSLFSTSTKAIGGLAGLVGSSALAYNSMKELREGSISSTEGILKFSGSLAGATASGALLGSVIPGVGTAVGALAGFSIGAVSAIIGLSNAQTDLTVKINETSKNIEEQKEKINEITSSYDEAVESINKNKEASLLNLEVTNRQAESLEKFIDTNGKVKSGYEDRVRLILGDLNEALGTEYKLTGNQITKNGELIKSYKDLKSNIDTYIAKRKEQIEAEAYEDVYKEKIKERIQLEKQVKEASENRIKAEEELKKALGNTTTASGFWAKQEASRNQMIANSNLKKAIENEQNLQKQLDNTKKDLDETAQKYEDKYKSIENTTTNTGTNILQNMRQNFAEQDKTIETNTPILTNRFKVLASSEGIAYSQGLNSTEGTVSEIADKLNQIVLNGLEDDPAYKKVAIDSIREFMKGLTTKEQKNLLKNCGIENTNEVIKGLKQGDLSEDVGINIVKGLQRGLKNNYWQGQTLTTAKSFANTILGKFKNTFGIHSPSKKTQEYGIYLLKGLGVGINKEQNNVLSTVKDFSSNLLNEFDSPIKELNKGIKVNTKDMSIDTTQYVNYGAISGQIQTQSKVNFGNMTKQIYDAVVDGMKNAKVQVDINAKTEEGVILKKATEGITDFVNRTGELPFPVPV